MSATKDAVPVGRRAIRRLVGLCYRLECSTGHISEPPELPWQTREREHFSDLERHAILEIAGVLDRLYEEEDRQIESNLWGQAVEWLAKRLKEIQKTEAVHPVSAGSLADEISTEMSGGFLIFDDPKAPQSEHDVSADSLADEISNELAGGYFLDIDPALVAEVCDRLINGDDVVKGVTDPSEVATGTQRIQKLIQITGGPRDTAKEIIGGCRGKTGRATHTVYRRQIKDGHLVGDIDEIIRASESGAVLDGSDLANALRDYVLRLFPPPNNEQERHGELPA